jgi:2-keto-4-pentenoate hydratase
LSGAVTEDSARRLLAARRSGVPLAAGTLVPADLREAYAVQEALARELEPIGGWKVGAAGPRAEPSCAPLPAIGLLPTGCVLKGSSWRLRGIEVEVALRLARDLEADTPPPVDQLQAAVAAVLPAIEVVESRLADWRESAPAAQLADLQNHGALVLGEASALAPAALDLRTVLAYLAFDGQPVASARGAHPVGDPWALLGWLAVHCTRRGRPLRKGQVVTTGSCSGLLFAPEGAHVQAELRGIGGVELRF